MEERCTFFTPAVWNQMLLGPYGMPLALAKKRSFLFQLGWMRLLVWRPSVSFTLVVASISINLLAFTLSLGIPSGASEVNPLVHPGSLASLAYSEGIIILSTFVLSALVRDEGQRTVILAAVVAVLTGDALNDLVFTLTTSQFLAVITSYASTALIPAFVATRWIRFQANKV